MKPVPKSITSKMRRIAGLSVKVRDLTDEVEEWFSSQGCDIHSQGSGSMRQYRRGVGLDELEYGNDVTDEIVELYMAGKFNAHGPEGSE